MKIKIERCPYYEGEEMFPYDSVDFPTGLTVLVGRNGIGKTTMINHIEHIINKRKGYKIIKFDNLTEGGSTSMGNAIFHGDLDLGSILWCSSEGQRISVNIGQVVKKIGATARTLKEKEKLVVLLDAIDSGLSIDNIIEVKEVFEMITDDYEKNGHDIFFIVCANEYEFPNGETCLDVSTGKFITFDNYDEYKRFILSQVKDR